MPRQEIRESMHALNRFALIHNYETPLINSCALVPPQPKRNPIFFFRVQTPTKVYVILLR